jgi:ankyrin repeat protein
VALILGISQALVHETDLRAETPLHFAACSSSINTLKMLLKAGGKIDAIDSRNRTPLYLAASHNQEVNVRMLLELGANVSLKTDQGYTALHVGKCVCVCVCDGICKE